MSAESIFRAVGGIRHGLGFVVRCPLQSHGQGRGDRSPSLSIRDGDKGLLVFCHAGCDSRDVFDELRRRGLLISEGTPRPEFAGPPVSMHRSAAPRPNARMCDRALAIWHEAENPRGTIVERYLASRRLDLPESVAGDVLRFHPACPFGNDRPPCMVALYRTLNKNLPVAVHRTALSADGQKIGRKMLGPVAGAAIKLDADADVTMGLVVGEGIETALTARQIGFRPAWALGSVGAIATFPLLPGIEALTILAEAGKPSSDAVQVCGQRWSAVGREVIIVSSRMGSDINDALRGAA
jgi:putative DNA primase/helicase